MVVSSLEFDGLVVKQVDDHTLRGIGWDPNAGAARRQRRRGHHVITGEAWAIRRAPFVERKSIYGCRMAISTSDALLRLEVDSPSDWVVAEALLSDSKSL